MARLYPIGRIFIFLRPDDNSYDDHDLDWVMDRALDAIIRHDIRVLLIDPWNEISHKRDRNDTTTDYTNRALSKLRAFARRHKILVIIVAHPTKSGAEKGADMTLYDISDSAAFQNKADFGVVVARVEGRDDLPPNPTRINITKVRRHQAGSIGEVHLAFDKHTRLFM